MAVEFRTSSVSIPNGKGRRSIEGNATFSAPVKRASVAMNGFKLDYASKDHHINVVEADTDVASISGNTVTFRVECSYAECDGVALDSSARVGARALHRRNTCELVLHDCNCVGT